MSSKGISPMIAVVLLVAFTVAVGGILSLWLTSYSTTTQESVGNATTDQIKCSGSRLDITVENATFQIVNPSTQLIKNVICYSSNGTDWQLGDISSASINASSWHNTQSQDGEYSTVHGSSIQCSGLCLTIGVSGECRSGQSCWNV